MTILGNKVEPEETQDLKSTIPKTHEIQDEKYPLEKAVIISFLAHPLSALLIKGLILLLVFLGINLAMFDRPEPKVRDIEFVLVNKPEQKPLNPKTKYRSDRNNRAGGKHDPKKRVSSPSPKAKKSIAQSKKPAVKTPASKPKPKAVPKVAKPKPTPPKPKMNKPIPKPKVSAPKPTPFTTPIPKTQAPKTLEPIGGPAATAPVGESTNQSAPSPMMVPSTPSAGSGHGNFNSPYSMSQGSLGNPGPGNPNGRPGIDTIKEPDFGPYMRELQRRIKRNWDPPSGNQSKRVVLLFKVAKDGRLLGIKVVKPSGQPSSDKAAIAAVELTAPFKPLPPEFRGKDVDIQFTFDYNVFGAGY